MNSEMPDGLSLEVRNAALPIRDALIAAGWDLGPIHWDGRGGDRKLAFSATSPAGAFIYVACGENDLTGRLQALLDSNKR
jgi:hypothetical protein